MEETQDNKEDVVNFHQMELDDRILKAVAKLGWVTPTLIQEKSIPFLLEGKDVLVRARTGSGKTAAFAIPAIQKVLNSKQTATEQLTTVLILAPSKELCNQIKHVLIDLTIKCGRVVRCVDLSSNIDELAQKHLLSERPDIVVSTPSRILSHLEAGTTLLRTSLQTLIIDEADLIFSFGFEEDLRRILDFLPPVYQAVLASATLSEDVVTLKQLVLHNPVTLKLQEADLAPASQLSHYHISAEANDKAAILYALLKLHLVRGKSIIFVNTVDSCYKLKLFLEQFAIKSCVLNSELPAKIRCHSVNQFNSGIYPIIIASDDRVLEQPSPHMKPESDKAGSDSDDDAKKPAPKKPVSKRKKDKESGVARGIDFQFVSNVINFDFPLDVNSYVHRAGRTARGNNSGSVLSFANHVEKQLLDKVEEHLKAGFGTDESVFKKYQFKLEEVEPFRYRASDAWRAITRIAIREARLKEIRLEIFNCDKLKSYFDNNPRDLQVLRHDKPLHTIKVQPHLAGVPDYIVPNALKRLIGVATRSKSKSKSKSTFNKNTNTTSKAAAIQQANEQNPLLCADIDYGKRRKFRK